MPDNFLTLSQRLLNRAPQVGIVLAQQLVNDAWRTLQARKDWSWRRRSGTFAPPTQYNAGQASTNVASGNPTLITGLGTLWTPQMVGSQIRIGGLLFPYYDIIGYISPTNLLIGQPWAGPDVSGGAYQIVQCFYPVPEDFGYFDWCVSVKDSFKIWTQCTQSELALWDPQRNTQGQTYCAAFRDFSSNYGGTIGPVIPVTSFVDPQPISTTSTGYSYPVNSTFIIQIVNGGLTGYATFQWMRAGQTSFTGPFFTSNAPQDLSDGVQVYWPDVAQGWTWNSATQTWSQDNNTWNSATQTWSQDNNTWGGGPSPWVAGDLFIINCQSLISAGVARYELWPTPTYNAYLYPYQYFAKESDLTAQQPTLPPPVANRGEMLLEMALEKCATFPGQDIDHPNPYFSLQLANYHRERYEQMLIDFENNDQNIGISNLDYDSWPYGGGVWDTGAWQQRHAPFL